MEIIRASRLFEHTWPAAYTHIVSRPKKAIPCKTVDNDPPLCSPLTPILEVATSAALFLPAVSGLKIHSISTQQALRWTSHNHGGFLSTTPTITKTFLTIYISLFSFHHFENYALRSPQASRSGWRSLYLRAIKWLRIPLPRNQNGVPTSTITETYFVNRPTTDRIGDIQPGILNLILPQFTHFDLDHLFFNSTFLYELTKSNLFITLLTPPRFLIAFIGSGFLCSLISRLVTQRTNPYVGPDPQQDFQQIERDLRVQRTYNLRTLRIELRRGRFQKCFTALKDFFKTGIELSKLGERGYGLGASAALSCMSTIYAMYPFTRTSVVGLAAMLANSVSVNAGAAATVAMSFMERDRGPSVPLMYEVVLQVMCDIVCFVTGTNTRIGHRSHLYGNLFGVGLWYGWLKWARAGSFTRLRVG